MHLVVPQFSVDKITLEDIRHDVAVSSNEICLALTHLGDYFQTHESDNKQVLCDNVKLLTIVLGDSGNNSFSFSE